MKQHDILPTLQTNSWFNELPAAIRLRLMENATRVPFTHKEIIHWQNDDDNCALYCVLSGAIKVSSCSWAGKEAVLAYLSPGNWFGEIAMLDGLHRTHTIQAHQDSFLLKVLKSDIMEIIAEYPKFYEHLIKLLCEKIRLLMMVIEETTLQPLPIRLAGRLLMLADSFGVDTPQGVEISIHLPQEELGQMLGTSRQSTNKLLKRFQQQGLIETKYRHVILKDLTRIKAMVQDS